MSYFLNCDEPHWVLTVWNSDMEETDDREVREPVDDEISYYWIESEERDEVLKVMDFIQGEEIVKKLGNNDLEDFENAEMEYEYAEIREKRPPQ